MNGEGRWWGPLALFAAGILFAVFLLICIFVAEVLGWT
jgi:hypothetical protein